MRRLLVIAGLSFFIASCSNYDKTASGLAYKIIKGHGKQQKLKYGDIIKIYATIKIAARDTVLYSTYNRLPEYLQVDTTSRLSHDFNEVLKYCSVGDSLVTVAQVDTLVKRGQAQYVNMFRRGDQIVTGIKILKVFKSREEQAQDQQQEISKEMDKERRELEKFIQKKGIKAERTASGVYVEMLRQGDTPKVTSGKMVTVKYKGSLLESGKVFDSNIDSSFDHTQPFTFMAGGGQTIRGWDEAMPMFASGGKGNLYIQPLLAYGPPGSPPNIPPYSALKFEIEVVKVQDAPPQQPQMPLGMGRPLQMQQPPAKKNGH